MIAVSRRPHKTTSTKRISDFICGVLPVFGFRSIGSCAPVAPLRSRACLSAVFFLLSLRPDLRMAAVAIPESVKSRVMTGLRGVICDVFHALAW